MEPRQRAEYIEQLKAMAAAGEIELNDYGSDDEAAFFDDNDLANRIWEDHDAADIGEAGHYPNEDDY